MQESIHPSYDRQATTLASRSSILAHSLTHSRSARLSGAWAAWAEFIPDKSCMQASSHGHGQSWPVRSGTGCDTRDSVAIPDLLPAAAYCLLPAACCHCHCHGSWLRLAGGRSTRSLSASEWRAWCARGWVARVRKYQIGEWTSVGCACVCEGLRDGSSRRKKKTGDMGFNADAWFGEYGLAARIV